jgi:hypothetical protein
MIGEQFGRRIAPRSTERARKRIGVLYFYAEPKIGELRSSRVHAQHDVLEFDIAMGDLSGV